MPFGRRNPLQEIESLLERLGRELEGERWPVLGAGVAVDVADHGDRYVVAADLPGLEREAVDVRLAAGVLTIEATREAEPDEEDVDYLRRERPRETSRRRVPVPEPVDEDAISAVLRHGVLTVELPKRAADGGTRIDID